ncbi:hypothetical protein GDO86_014631 [Hymenochirus boettgeri]|uniref:TNFR-Cys domain-containing protein n=1 Tax=Hymenochirus boettgeri TaxID=247094 RepID=A0A8T2JY04_9PIPI|nr:hypothetical protein GDO86_014631 [Hymenochirus boettgeri]
MHCTSNSRTKCRPCPENHYTQYWNYLESCRYCNVFCEGRERVKQHCSATHNRVCECQPGFYRGSQFCVRHKECGPGYRVSQSGTAETDTECSPCPPGTYSDNHSTDENCQPHVNCSALGKEINVPGTSHHNTLCRRCSREYEVNRDCDEDVADFVFHLNLLVGELQHLQRILSHPDRSKRKSQQQRNVKLLLNEVRENHPERPFLPQLLHVLRTARLAHMEGALKKQLFGSDSYRRVSTAPATW